MIVKRIKRLKNIALRERGMGGIGFRNSTKIDVFCDR